MTVKVQNTDMNSERQKALENAMHQITREFGAGAIMRLGDMKGKLDTEVIPTGSLALDIAVGVGGYPRGRVIEIYGPESSGKTTLALHAIAEAQKAGHELFFISCNILQHLGTIFGMRLHQLQQGMNTTISLFIESSIKLL